MADGIPARLTPAEGRKFAFPVGAAFLVLAGIVWWRQHAILLYIFASLGGALWAAGFLIPGSLGPVYRGWMRFALLLSKITTPILMGIVFFLVIGPIGSLMRLFGKNPMKRQRQDDTTYWVARESGSSSQSDLTRQF